MIPQTTILKEELSTILDRYVPQDDRSYILDRIDQEFSTIVDHYEKERENSQALFFGKAEEERTGVRTKVAEIVEKAKTSTKKAYLMGLAEGEAKAKPGVSFFQIAVTVGVLALAAMVVVREFRR